MRIHYLCAPVAAAIALFAVPSQAGPCSPEIDRMQARVDAMIAATAAAGPAGRQSTAAEARLDEGARAQRALAALERARVADRAGDNSTCERALADAQREVGSQ